MKFDLQNKKLLVEEYWDIVASRDSVLNKSIENNIEDMLTKSLDKRKVSEKPIGVFLSGGVDSSLVLALLDKSNYASKIKTFSIGFEEK